VAADIRSLLVPVSNGERLLRRPRLTQGCSTKRMDWCLYFARCNPDDGVTAPKHVGAVLM
jgi:hypothetical protein